MGLMDFIKGELIDVIEWTDDSRDTLSFRYPDDDKAIKNGAQLIVRESQQVQFIYVGEFGDTFGPGKLKTRALVDRVHGVYIPYWTFDAQVVCPWDAEAGHYYYTTETYQEGGRTRTRQVRHVRWVPASGEIQHFFDDEPIPGTRGVSHALLKQVEPFPTQELRPYDRAYLSGFVVEHYQIVLFDAAQSSQEAMAIKLQAMAAAQIPGDTYRNLQIHPVYSARTFKHILVPVWLLSYNFREKAYQVVVNGVTGRMAGEYPKSPWKIALLVLAAIIVALTIAMLSQN